MNVGIIDYGMGNLASVSRAVRAVGYDAFVAEDPAELRRASRLILPGVGGFAEGMDRLDRAGWTQEVRRLATEEAVPLLGICLGMQFLADSGVEGGERQGLALVPGVVRHLADVGCTERVPHVGWNELHVLRPDPLLSTIADATDFYFVHSYAFVVSDPSFVLATVDYGAAVPALVRRDNIWGAQFHPEKSSKAGLQILRNFVEAAPC